MGSAGAVVLYLLTRDLLVGQPLLFAGLILVTLVSGALSATEVEHREGTDDPSKIVVDEVVGQWLALFLLPFSWPIVIAAFVLFRAFDIWKPFPVRAAERVGHGVGVMLDDVVAGVYANLVIRLLLLVPVVAVWLR